MTLTPRDYQKTAVDTITASHINNNMSRIVLAASTGSGKTEMAIMIIEHFVKNGLGKVLVIAHHTNIIKSNFLDRLNVIKPNFTYSDTDTDVDCFVAIRSGAIYNKIDDANYSLLIVDEAHQNYFATTIQNIACRINHQVLLTATPSKFVAHGGFDILPIARLDIPSNYFASLSFRVINAETSITDTDYNRDGVVRSAKNFNRTEVKSMCDSVIPYLDNNKKLFICKDIEQAQHTAKYLTSKSIATFVSDSVNDPDGVIADQFKSGYINSLCVVDRMRVGYSDNDLYHTIDMSFTHNPDVIMQILSRSNRGNQSQSKTYIKVTNNALNARSRFMLSLSLSLFHRDNLLAYDGNNASTIKIPVQKQPSGRPVSRSLFDTNEFFIPDGVDVVNFFNSCDFVDSNLVINCLSGRIDYQQCVDLIRANDYKKYNDFRVSHRGHDHYLIANNLIDTICSETSIIPPTKRSSKSSSIDDMIKVAANYVTISEFIHKHKTFYKAIKSANMLDHLIGSDGLPLNKKRGFKIAKFEKVCVICSSSYLAKVKTSQVCSDTCKNKRNNINQRKSK